MSYEFIERLIKNDFADWNQPDEEINHLLIPVLDEETFTFDRSETNKLECVNK